jgi:hypothetical protein
MAKRRWPRRIDRDDTAKHDLDHIQRDQTPGWEA